MTLDKRLLDIICCPVTHQPLVPMQPAQLEALNVRIAKAGISTLNDTRLTEALSEALVTRDGKLAYPLHDGIPMLLEECGIALSQLEA